MTEKIKNEYYIQMKRVILSGGGTGGHIYPAVAVAEALQRRCGDGVELLFVGAEGKMEMEKIPALGYRIVGLPTAGLQRRFALSNLALPFKVLKSVGRARRTIREFGADVVVGFGGYASGPVLWAAQRLGIPTLIQEQNSYAGLTNKILAHGARRICVAYDGMERFFPAERIAHTGNPLRGRFAVPTEADRLEGLAAFGLDAACPTVLVVGGSLGCRTLNETMKAWLARQEFRPPCLCRGRRRGVAQRRLLRLGAVSGGQTHALRPLAQRGRRSPDQERAGTRRPAGCRSGRRRRSARTGHGDGGRTARRPRTAGAARPQHRGAGRARRGGADRRRNRKNLVRWRYNASISSASAVSA